MKKILLFSSLLAFSSSVFGSGIPFKAEPLSAKICVVNPPQKNESLRNRPCLDHDVTPYEEALESLSLLLPELYRKTFDSLQNIYIETDPNYFRWSGYAWFHDVSDVNNLKGGYLRFGKEKLDLLIGSKTKSFAQWYKEDILYQFKDPSRLGSLSVEWNGSDKDALLYLVAHELTHIIDLTNGLNSIKEKSCAEKIIQPDAFTPHVCEFNDDSYSSFSWVDTYVKKASREDLRYLNGVYCPNCPVFESHEIGHFLNALYVNSSFISPYATTGAWEDLAEVAAIIITSGENRTPLKVTYEKGGRIHGYNVMISLQSGVLMEKRFYFDNLLNNTNLKTPGYAK